MGKTLHDATGDRLSDVQTARLIRGMGALLFVAGSNWESDKPDIMVFVRSYNRKD